MHKSVYINLSAVMAVSAAIFFGGVVLTNDIVNIAKIKLGERKAKKNGDKNYSCSYKRYCKHCKNQVGRTQSK